MFQTRKPKDYLFRGVDDFTGQYRYGDLQNFEDSEDVMIINRRTGHGYRVKPDSVTLLAGYDNNGDKVFDGDKLKGNLNDITDEAVIFTASIAPLICEETSDPLDWDAAIETFNLTLFKEGLS